MIELILAITFAFTTVVSLYVVFNLYKKVDLLEQWTDATYISIQNTLTKMRDIDATGHFEADDEVGTIFKELDETLNELDKITEE